MTSNTGVTNAMQSLTLSQCKSNNNYCYIDCNTATVKEKKTASETFDSTDIYNYL